MRLGLSRIDHVFNATKVDININFIDLDAIKLNKIIIESNFLMMENLSLNSVKLTIHQNNTDASHNYQKHLLQSRFDSPQSTQTQQGPMQDNREKTNEEVSRLAEAAHLPHLTGPMRATPWSMDPRVKNGPASSLRVQVNNDKEDEDEDEAAAVEAEATSITAVSQDELPADQLLASAAPAVGDAVYKASSDALTPPSAQPLDASTMVSNWQSSIQEWFSGTATGPAQLFGLLGGFLVFHRVANDGSSAPVTAPTAPTEPTEPTEPIEPLFSQGEPDL